MNNKNDKKEKLDFVKPELDDNSSLNTMESKNFNKKKDKEEKILLTKTENLNLTDNSNLKKKPSHDWLHYNNQTLSKSFVSPNTKENSQIVK